MLSFPMSSSSHTSLPAPTLAPHNHKNLRPIISPATPLESTFPQVFIPISLKSLGISVYKKTGGGALLLLTRFPTRKSVLTSVARKDPSPRATTGGSHLVGRELSSRPTIPFAAGLAPPCQAFPHSTFNFRLSTVSHKLQHKGGPASPIRHDDPLQYCDFNFQLSTFNRHNSTPPHPKGGATTESANNAKIDSYPGGDSVSTEAVAARRHAGTHLPVTWWKLEMPTTTWHLLLN